MILRLNNNFIPCIPIRNYNISYLNHIVHKYLYVDQSIRSDLCNLALIPYVMSLLALDANMCRKAVKFLFCSFITTKGFNLLAANFTRNFIFIMSKTMCIVKQLFDNFLSCNSSIIYTYQHCIIIVSRK